VCPKWAESAAVGLKWFLVKFTVTIEQCPDTGLYVGYLPDLPGAHSQGKTLEDVIANLREVIVLVLGVDGQGPEPDLVPA
jgi:predicted RNase H-like HicB family nuclease